LIKLLLADDSVTIQRVVELTFSGEDVQVTSVSDGEQAIARLRSELPDIVLADVGMPKRDGYEVAAYVKGYAELAHIPVILLAGAFEPVDEARAKEVRCDGVLVKPFEPQQVIARVRELVEAAKPAAKEARTAAPPFGGQPPARTSAPPASRTPVPAAASLPVERQGPSAKMSEGRLDEYFDRLDAAFASLGSAKSAAGRGPADDPFADKDLPTLAGLVGDPSVRSQSPVPEFGRITAPPVEPPDVSPTLASAPREPAPAAHSTPAGSNAIAEVFRVLFAAEHGDRDALQRFQGTAQPVVTDDLVNEVTRRVLERLAPDTARQLVADIVSEVAERLVREEIERIRKKA
jgi:CheY-like chemotaxis protein